MEVIDQRAAVSRETMITQWYEEVFPVAASYVKRKGGDLETAKELFQAAIVSYYEKQLSSDFHPDVGDQAYLIGIVKKKWLKYCQNSSRTETLSKVDVKEENEPRPIVTKVLSVLRLSGQRCLDLLQSFYFERLSIDELATRFGYASTRSASVQKYKCLEKVRNEVKQQSMSHEDFFE